MADSCHVCGSTDSLMSCKRCKTVAYCSAECQRSDWKTHKDQCKRKELADAPCDSCQGMDKHIGDCCYDCGFLLCKVCHEQNLTRNAAGVIVGFAPCPGCHREGLKGNSSRKKLEKIVEKKSNETDPRLTRWLLILGNAYVYERAQTQKGDKKAKKTFLRAGDLGFGEGYSRLAELYLKERNWTEAKLYYKKAADLHNVVALNTLGEEAILGYFIAPSIGILQRDQRREPDCEEAFYYFREGARLGAPICCANVGVMYYNGEGVREVNYAKAFKWSKKAADMGDPGGMRQCGKCFLFGNGVDQSNEQAQFWFEKSLTLEEDEEARYALRCLQNL